MWTYKEVDEQPIVYGILDSENKIIGYTHHETSAKEIVQKHNESIEQIQEGLKEVRDS